MVFGTWHSRNVFVLRSKIDAAFENIFNIFFYGIMTVIVLGQLGFDPLAMFLSISGVILAFAFSECIAEEYLIRPACTCDSNSPLLVSSDWSCKFEVL